ncbi:MAG: amino acid carrier protein [Alphaproteobacteria bacterium]
MMISLHSLLETVAGYLWGWPMLVLLMGTGLMMNIALRGLPLRLLVPSMWDALGPKGSRVSGSGAITNRAALMTALAATVGTGNIAGVATAIALGGPGAVFWMWVSGIIGIALKFAEALLGVHYRSRGADGHLRGGPMSYLSKGVGLPWLGTLYGALIGFAALCVGGMVQSNSMADSLLTTFGWSPMWVGLVVAGSAAVIMFGGLGRIAQAADKLVPLMIGVYVLVGTLILLANAAYVLPALKLIVTSAFTGTAATGGFAGAAVMMAMRFGLARGIFSNESGLGSAAIVAATAQTKHPVEQALVSMTQTFIDTIVVCTFTALVIVVTGVWQSTEVASAGASLTGLAFSTGLGGVTVAGIPLGAAIVAVCLVLFSFTTVLGWGYYGQQGAVHVWGPKVAKPYLVLFLILTFMGAYMLQLAASVKDGVLMVWLLADIATGLLMIPNLFGLWVLRKQVVNLTHDYLAVEKRGGAYKYKAFHEEMPKVKTRK